MDEYIKRKDAIARFTFEQGDYIPEKLIDGHDNVIAVRTIKRVLREIPEEDVAPVRHGRWIHPVPGDGENYCSVCHAEQPWFYGYGYYEPDYCPNCGALGIPAEKVAELVGKDEMKRIEQGGMELFLSKLNEEVSDESVREFVAECEGVK